MQSEKAEEKIAKSSNFFFQKKMQTVKIKFK